MNYETFLNSLTRIEILSRTYDEQVAAWGSDLKVVILGGVGYSIIRHIAEFSDQDLIYIFGIIERGIQSNDDTLSTQVVTGLVEAMSNAAEKAGKLSYLMAMAGEETKRHINAVNHWCGVEVPKRIFKE